MRWNFSRTSKFIAALCPPLLLATLAVVNQGVPLSQLDLNDGSVWLTSTSEMKLGRYNPRIDELDGGVVSESGRFDVRQEENNVILVEPTTASVIDAATVAATVEIHKPAGADVQLSEGNVAVIHPETGDMWLAPFEQFSSINTQDDAPIVAGPHAGGVLAENGRLLTVSEEGETSRFRISSDGEITEKNTGQIGEQVEAGEWEDITAVGEQIIGLRDGQVYVSGHAVDIGPGDAVLQQPGPDADGVLVALEDRLLEVPLSGEEPRELARVGVGAPAAPVIVNGCRHGAWAAAADNYIYDCDGDEALSPITLGGVTSVDELVFRVNRSVVVLNDVKSGRLWLPEEDTEVREPNWQDIVPEEEPEDTDETTGDPTDEVMQAECSDNAPAPQAHDDEYGVRAGRTRTLEVLSNDTTSDCGILAISEFDEIPQSFGELHLVAGGRALEISVAPNATGTTQFTYTVTDGRGSSTPSTATVELTVRAPGENDAPVQDRIGTLTVEQGGEGTYNILSDFSDPDGDDLFITDAFSTSSGIVRYRNDGQITFIADGDDLGRREVRVVVSDGMSSTEGALNVDVRPPGSLAPIIDPLHEVAYVDEVITVKPLNAVRTATQEPAVLASVEEPSGTEVLLDSEAGTFTFTSAQAGTYYVPFSVVSIPHESIGLVRIDVREREEEPQPPQAVRDIALLPPGGEITIDPLANDIDPTRGVMVLQSVDVPEDSGLRVGILQHQLLQISATRVLEEPVSFTYVVSNGVGEDVGEVSVLPVPASESQRAPVVPDVKVSVRTGGVVTIPVLEGAYDPDGDPLTLDRELPQPLPSGEGLLFVSGDLLRYQAPDRPLETHAIFSVRDIDGNATSAQLTVTVHESNPDTKAPPTPKDLTARVFAGETVRIPIPLTGIDADGDGVVLLGQAEAPEKGRITGVGADWLEYEALPGESGLDTFTYAVEDWVGQRAVATVRVGIAERPTTSAQIIARDDEVTVRPGELVEVRVLTNDIDASGGELALSEQLEHEEGIEAWVEGRRVVVQTRPNQDGSVLQILYEATNDRGGHDTGMLTVYVDSQAELVPPIARDVVVPASDTIDRTSIEVDVLEVAENPSGSRSDLRVEVPTSAQDVATVTPSGTVLVTLGESSQTIPYRLRNIKEEDANLISYAFITVPALGDYPPMLRPRAPRLTVVAGEKLVVPLAEQIKVAPGKRARITSPDQVSAVRSDGSSLVQDLETLVFQAPRNYAGPASISFEVTDGQSGDPAAGVRSFTLPITVFAAEDNPPRFSPSTVEVAPGEEARSVDLDAFTSSPSGETETGYSYRISGSASSEFDAEIVDSRLYVSADIDVPRGTTGTVDIEIDYGGISVIRGTVPLRVTASSRALARVLDHEIADGVEGQATSVAVLSGAFNPFDTVSPLRVVDAVVETPNAGSARVNGANVEVRPDNGFIGTMVTRFRVADGTGDRAREVEGRIRVRVRGVPDAPSRPRIGEVRDRTVVLSWDAPAANGEPIDRYRVTHSPGGSVTECAATTCTIDGLTNDTRYRFTVAAHNAVGWSEPSSQSDEARPDTKPNRPQAPELEFGDGEIIATWPAPDSPGSPVKNYQLQITPAPPSGATANTTRTTHRFTGLQNGTQYTVRVRAENDAPDPSDWSDSSRMTPAGVPASPQVAATKEVLSDFSTGGEIKATWERPSSNGDAISEYRVKIFDNSNSQLRNVKLSADARSYVFAEARNGTQYRVEVEARNKAGWSRPGVDTSSRFSVPEQVSAQASAGEFGSGKVRVTWEKPRDGGSEITHYQVERDGEPGSELAVSEGRSREFSSSVGGTAQNFRVRAKNSAGWGKWSSVVTATPTTVPAKPDTPTAVSATPSALKVEWPAVANGGISDGFGYTVRYWVNGSSRDPINTASRSATIPLTVPVGETWNVRVEIVARNSAGASKESEPLQVTIKNAPAKPQQVSVSELTRSWWVEDREFKAEWGSDPSVSEYDVRWYVNGMQEGVGSVGGSTEVKRSFPNLAEGDNLRFEVRAIAGNLRSEWVSKEITVGPDPRTGDENGS